uniref:Uncharacterized protein n=1 Tax=Cacopsylla melanoneura TaxID=428564 RepID=A0A8D8LRD9_9HEMI
MMLYLMNFLLFRLPLLIPLHFSLPITLSPSFFISLPPSPSLPSSSFLSHLPIIFPPHLPPFLSPNFSLRISLSSLSLLPLHACLSLPIPLSSFLSPHQPLFLSLHLSLPPLPSLPLSSFVSPSQHLFN